MTRRVHRRDVAARLLTASVLLVVLVSFAGIGFATPGNGTPGLGGKEATETAPPVAEPEAPPAEEPPAEEPPAEEPPAAEPVTVPPAEEPVLAEAPAPEAKAAPQVATRVEDPSTPVVLNAVITPSDQGVTPVYYSGNPPADCPDHLDFKINGIPANGTYNVGQGMSIIVSNATSYSFDYEAVGMDIHEVFVKASNGANHYDYDAVLGHTVTWDGNMLSVAKDPSAYTTVVGESPYYDISHVQFCYSKTPSWGHILVRKYDDSNADGDRDGGEAWLSGWTFELYRSDGDENGPWTLVDTKTTVGPNGMADFGNRPPDYYKIVEVMSGAQVGAGWVSTTGLEKVFYHVGEVNGQAVDEEHWFGNRQLVTKTFTLTYEGDVPANTTFAVKYDVTLPGETVQSVTLPLDPKTESIQYPKGTVIGTVGWYAVWTYAPGMSAEILLGTTAGETLLGDELNTFVYGGEIYGYKYEDKNADGLKTGDPVMQGWEIVLERKVGSDWYEVGRKTTGADGKYRFYSVLPGEYRISEVMKTDYDWHRSYPSGEYHYCEVAPRLLAGALGVECVGTSCRKDFLNWAPASIEGMKFNDLDRDGINDDEPGLADWLIYVDYDNDDVHDTDEPYDITDANGDYLIEGVKPGTWTVREQMLGGWTQSVGSFVVSFESRQHYVSETGEYDFGNWTYASKSGMKFHDLDADGAKDAGEPGLSGWTVFVDYNGNGSYDAGEPSDVTGTDGSYSIGNIQPGTYKVYEVMQQGWTQSFPADGYYEVEFTSGLEDDGNDFGNWTDASIVGKKFHDLDADGVKEPGEPGLGGWTIYVDYDNDMEHDADEPSDVTESDGAYEIDGVKPGTWWVREVQQATWTQSRGDFQVTFASDGLYGEEGEYDFGNWTTTGFSGYKFEDKDADGTWDAGEPGLAGWTIKALGNTADGIVSVETSTGANGYYEFSGLVPGSYVVTEIIPPAPPVWTQSFPALGYHSVTLASGMPDQASYDFGNWTYIDPYGYKFHDVDADGEWDADEPGLGGWEIHLDGYAGDGTPVSLVTTTAADGSWSFPSVPPGSYTISETQQTGWTQSFPADPGTHDVTFESGDEPAGPYDFGNYTTGKKYGTKFEDLNANGVWDAGEPGLANWLIFVDYDNDGEADADEPQALTGANGSYALSGIEPGTWWIREVMKQDYSWTQSLPGDPDYGYYETFTSGLELRNNDFGNWRPASIQGVKFEDADADGVFDNGEDLLEGWRIYVDYNGNDAYDAGEPTDVTDEFGYWEIDGITPGTYEVREVLEADWHQSRGNFTVTFVSGLDYGQEGEYDFGNWYDSKKGGMKFEDLNADGVKDPGEPGLSGWTIFVDYDGDGDLDADEPSAVTDADGFYTIDGIVPGTYMVYEVMQGDFVQSLPGSPLFGYEETFTSSSVFVENDFGNWEPASIMGMKFEDLDADGVKEPGELGLGGWTIYVDYDGDGVLDPEEPRDTTDSDGYYQIDGVTPGTYMVREVAQSDWTQSRGDFEVTFESGGFYGEEGEFDFGNWTYTRLEGYKFHDLNADGDWAQAEPGLEGWEIHLDGFDGAGAQVHLVTFTDTYGYYEFDDLAPGDYVVSEVVPSGWTQSYPAAGTWDVELRSGDEGEDYDFGNWTTAQKFGTKFYDADGDGEPREEGEEGLEGWTIFVDYNDNSVLDSGEPFGVSDEDGAYSISGIVPGTWSVREVSQPDWKVTYPADGLYEETFVSQGVTEGNDFGNTTRVPKTFELTLTSGAPAATSFFVTYEVSGESTRTDLVEADGVYTASNDIWPQSIIENVEWFAEWNGAEIKLGDGAAEELIDGPLTNEFEYDAAVFGAKWNDTDFETGTGDGVWDTETEPGIEGFTIQLYRQNAAGGWVLYDTAVTDADGEYAFNGVLPGRYYLAEVIPVDAASGLPLWVQSAGPMGEGDMAIEIENGAAAGPVDFGNYEPFAPLIDMGIEKTVDKPTANPGELLTYKLTYTMVAGSLDDGEVYEIYDDYDETYLTPVDTAGGTVDKGAITWTLEGPIAEGATGTITVTFRVASTMPKGTTNLDNAVVISTERDSNPDNDRDTARATVTIAGEPFLPFTGGDYMQLGVLLVMFALGGGLLRRAARSLQ